MGDLSAVGFGQKPQIAFPGGQRAAAPYKSWRPIEQATMSYGYGLSASLFQMARSYTVFANGGKVIPATMLKTDAARRGRAGVLRAHGEPGAQDAADGRRPRRHGPEGADRGLLGGRQVGHGAQAGGQKSYATGKYRAWFTGMAPVDKPRIIVAVMIDEPSNGVIYGGAVAAPVFSEVVQQTLRMMAWRPTWPSAADRHQRGGGVAVSRPHPWHP